jgi:hypothetical protein
MGAPCRKKLIGSPLFFPLGDLQPAPEVFELFDDVMLLSEGQIVYQTPGVRARVL